MNEDIQARIAAGKAHLQNELANQNPQTPQQQIQPSTPPSPVNLASNEQCPQCGHFHPPVADGKCPLAQQKTESGKVVDVNPFLAKMRDIVSSQVQMKKIQDPDKFFAHIIVELTKVMENYNE